MSRYLHFENNHQYIVIDGLVLDGAHVVREVVKITYANDPATSAHHIRIQNSELKNAPAQGILVGGATGFNEFINLTVHDNGRTDFEHGMYIANDNNVIDRCTVYRNAGWGLHLFGGSPSHNTVRNNRVYNNARAGARGPGIGIYGPNNLAYNNVLWGNNGGFELDGTANVELYNNTIYNNNAGTDGPGIAIGVASNMIIRNNIIYQDSFSVGGTGTVADHNLVGVDPGFVSAVSFDFRLNASSLAIDAGATIATVTADADGIKRPQGGAYDIGAYEYDFEAAATKKPPKAPRNVRILRPQLR